MNTGLTGKLAALDKTKSQPDKPVRTAQAESKPQAAARQAGTAKSAPKVGATRTITIRHLTDDDLRRLSEFRYTHNMTIQDITIKASRCSSPRWVLPAVGHVRHQRFRRRRVTHACMQRSLHV